MLESDKESRWYVPQKLMLYSNNKSKENSDHLLFQLMGFFFFFPLSLCLCSFQKRPESHKWCPEERDKSDPFFG